MRVIQRTPASSWAGNCDDSVGYFIEPTIIHAHDPHFKTIEEEIFGPVFTFYLYDDAAYEETLELCDSTSAYALTGAIFANDREAVELASRKTGQRRRQFLHQR